MDPQYRAATEQDIPEVASKRLQCTSQFNLTDLVTSMLRLYNLLITLGHWPLDSLHIAPHATPPIDTTLATHLNFSPLALEIIQSLPYPTDQVRYNHDHRILELTSLLDLTDPDDLAISKYPTGSNEPCLPEHVFSLTAPAADGTTLLFDAEMGAVYEEAWHAELSGRHLTTEYRVARHLNGVPATEDWQLFDAGREARHEYLPFMPAKQWFDEQYDRWYSLRRLQGLDARYEGDRDMDLDEVGPRGDWERDFSERKQRAVVELMERLGWPDERRWDREEFVRIWEGMQKEFRREQVERGRREDVEEDENENGG